MNRGLFQFLPTVLSTVRMIENINCMHGLILIDTLLYDMSASYSASFAAPGVAGTVWNSPVPFGKRP